jgi:uncharacterized protein
MPHQCTRCGKIYRDAAEELLKGCGCGSKFFFYIKQERLDEIKEENAKEMVEVIKELEKADKDQIEKDIREITGMDKEPDKPVILDLESVKVLKPGKFEIDIVNLFNKRRPLIYKLEEGKYIIDLASSLRVDKEEIAKKIRDPNLVNNVSGSAKNEIKEDLFRETLKKGLDEIEEKYSEGEADSEEEAGSEEEDDNENETDDEDKVELI